MANLRAAQLVLPCRSLDATVAFLCGQLGLQVERVLPADAPEMMVLSGLGLNLRLQACKPGDPPPAPATLVALVERDARAPLPEDLRGPDGLHVRFEDADPPVVVPVAVPRFLVTRLDDGAAWHLGRAGMQYRDLVPGRLGGHLVASHIRIPEGGEVPDYVHFHRVRFQMICCHRGWVRVVYQDQGPPFVMHAGDVVLQPPGIRHRVLEASPGLEVIELGVPAIHLTQADPATILPGAEHRPGRRYGGQLFVHHVANAAEWRPGGAEGVEYADTGIATATDGYARVTFGRARRDADVLLAPATASGATRFLFVRAGTCALGFEDAEPHALDTGDACVLPGVQRCVLRAGADAEWLDVQLCP